MKTLRDLFLDELADMYDAERRIVKALPKMTEAATGEDLKAAFLFHLKETEGHVKKLEEVFQSFDKPVKGKTCEATVGLLEEADEIAEEFAGSSALDAALIAAAQKVEHYEIATYGCLHEWAGLLGNQKAARLLEGILEQEKGTDVALTELARASSNEEAMGDGESGESEEPDPKQASKATGTKPSASPLRRRTVVASR